MCILRDGTFLPPAGELEQVTQLRYSLLLNIAACALKLAKTQRKTAERLINDKAVKGCSEVLEDRSVASASATSGSAKFATRVKALYRRAMGGAALCNWDAAVCMITACVFLFALTECRQRI